MCGNLSKQDIMGWVNTCDKRLINSVYISEIKLIRLSYKDDHLGFRIDLVLSNDSNDFATLGFFENIEQAEEALYSMIYREYYYSPGAFRDICRKTNEVKTLRDKSDLTKFDDFWKESEILIDKIFEDCTEEECEVDLCS
jgi:hypothetical protein